MPQKIITDQPQARRRTIQVALGTTYAAIAEAPYFSVPMQDAASATVDPADADRELRPGELFIVSGIQIANTTTTARTVEIELVAEGGSPVTMLAPTLTVPPREVLTLPPGLSLFKRNLANPTADGMLMRARASAASALQLTLTVVEREAIEHAPDTE